MKIFDSRRDIYDGMQSYGTDPKLVYERDKKIGEFIIPHQGSWNSPQEFEIPYRDYISDENITLKHMLLGVAGRFIPLVTDSNDKFFYSAEDVLDWKYSLKRNHCRDRSDHKDKELDTFFNTYNNFKSDKYFIQLGVPLLTVKKGERNSIIIITPNPILNDYNYGKIQDPFTLYQDIAVYLGNTLVKEKQPSDIPDNYKVTQHGFDKYSFRHPTKLKDLT